MQDLMRKHKNWILGFILGFVALPMIFIFGMPAWSGKTAGQGDETILATADGEPVYVTSYIRQLNATAKRLSGNGNLAPTYYDLFQSGDSQRILEQLLGAALLRSDASKRDFKLDRTFIAEQMKKDPYFQDDEGNYDPELWNVWVRRQEDANTNWDDIYAGEEQKIAQQIYMTMLLSSATRVLDKDIEKQLQDRYTKLKIKYAKIAPELIPTEEQIQKQYANNMPRYTEQDSYAVDYVAFSLIPEVPAVALDIVKQAREGADFAALAKEHSTVNADNGGDMGWVIPRDKDLPYLKPLFALPLGQVSDPVYSANAYHIFKVEEERTNEDTGKREVKARQIFMKATLTPVEQSDITATAQTFANAAKESGDLAQAAQAASLSVQRTGQLNAASATIDNLTPEDLYSFRAKFSAVDDDTNFSIVEAVNANYVIQIAETIAGSVPALDVIRDRVTQDALRTLQRDPEYQAKITQYADDIQEKATSLENVATLFPELKLEILESEPFGQRDYQALQQLFPMQVFAALDAKEAGELSEAIPNYFGDTYFAELVERIGPTEEDKANWEEESKQLRAQAIAMAQREMLDDYMKDRTAHADAQGLFYIEKELIQKIHAAPEAPEEEAAEATGTPEEDAGDAPTEEEAPVSKEETPVATE